MSKAFTQEDAAQTAPVSRPVPKLSVGETRYITRDGHQRLVAQMREQERAPKTVDGAAKVARLKSLLEVLTVAGPPADLSHATFGAWVELESEDGTVVVYRLVGPDEVDVEQKQISIHSPLARSLIGRGIGERVVVHLPRGWREYTVVGISEDAPTTH